MSIIDKKTVEYVAALARINLSPQELEKLSGQLQEILSFIDQLNKVEIKDTLPTSHILPLNNVLRSDAPLDSLPVAKTLENAPQKEGKFFVVPKVIE